MTFQYDGYNHLVRLNKGELLISSLTQLIKEQNIKGAWVSGIGAAQWAELGYYQLDSKEYHWQKFDELMEITSLQGNVAWKNNEPIIHIHGTFTNSKFMAYGGHVKELMVGGTCEILLHRWYKDGLNRTPDAASGLDLLDL